uniref:Protein kinase domain-containing protein n=1 Tax=Haemonchus contortus TaxID=6289 RepID=A0A7I4YBY0_HAECO|nr:Serine threonine protein kinase-related domain containing protein [Haemonchus contortus]
MTTVGTCDLSSHGYTVQQWIGHCFDGAGDIFLGRCNDSARVAIKRIPLDALDITYDPSRAESSGDNTRTLVHAKAPDKGQLLREDIRLMRLLRHPHIVDFHACFVDGLSIYLVLGSCNYGSASDVILSSYQCGIPEKAIALILRQLLSALVYLHAQQIIHRSIRASHILLDSAGGVRLTGFRLARKLRPGETTTTDFDNHVEASLLWLAPEVLGQDLSGYSTRADIYSVGTTLCEMANGFPPFGDMNRLEMLYEKSRGTTPRLLDSTTLPPYEEPSEHSTRTFSEAFHSITGLCLKVDPANRPDANSLLSHPFLKKTKKTFSDLMPLAQTLDQIQRVSGKKDTTPEPQRVPEWVF